MADGDEKDQLVRWFEGLDLGTVRTGGAGAPVPALSAVPEAATIAGVTVTLSTHLSRDFMPFSPPDGKPLLAIVNVLAQKPGELPSTVRADRIAVVHGEQVWVAPLIEEAPRGRTGSKIQLVARHGPTWGPGVLVDVVVQLRQGAGIGDLVLVRASRQLIQQVW